MTTYTKTILIIAGLILIPAVLISQKYTSADYINLSVGTNSSSNTTSPTLNTDASNNITIPNLNLDDTSISVPDIITTPDVIIPPSNTFLFFDTNIFPGIDSWDQIIPNIIIPDTPPEDPLDTSIPPTVTTVSLFEAWQDIKDKPIGVFVDEDKKAEIFEERKQVFDAWFEEEWQKMTDPISACDSWWCIDPPAWVKTTAYNLQKFDFSYDWAWDQFVKDNL